MLVGWLMASLVCRLVSHLVCWLLLCGLVDWLFALLTDGFGCFVGWLVGWLLVLVRRSVSHLDDQSISEFGGWLVGELGWLVGELDEWVEG